MTTRIVSIALAAALAASLGACATEPSASRLASAERTPVAASLGVVHSPADCAGAEENSFGGCSRPFGNTTPWAENPYLNPCGPN
jgi:hypothetical protein